MAERAATALANQDAGWLAVQPPAALERAPERTIEGINTLAGVAEIRQPQGADPSPQFDSVKPCTPNPQLSSSLLLLLVFVVVALTVGLGCLLRSAAGGSAEQRPQPRRQSLYATQPSIPS